MRCRLQFAPYMRPFSVPLRTARGDWYEREGIVLRLEDEGGRVGYGEVAPLELFGSETLQEARDFLEGLGDSIEDKDLSSVPENLPCCRFALGSAWWMIEQPMTRFALRNTALLPSGEAAIDALVGAARKGFLCFKVKIGIDTIENELALVDSLLSRVPIGGKLRLDGNGAFMPEELDQWLDFLDGRPAFDFMEQPMAPGSELQMQRIAQKFDVDLALDESVADTEQLRRAIKGIEWRGPIVLKASILGAPGEIAHSLGNAQNRLVFSSVFETGVGLLSALRLASVTGTNSPVGFGTMAFFADDLNLFPTEAVLDSDSIDMARVERLWERICEEFSRI